MLKDPSIVRLMPYFGKVGRSVSEEVILQLITSKCIPILLYGFRGLFSYQIRPVISRLYYQSFL